MQYGIFIPKLSPNCSNFNRFSSPIFTFKLSSCWNWNFANAHTTLARPWHAKLLMRSVMICVMWWNKFLGQTAIGQWRPLNNRSRVSWSCIPRLHSSTMRSRGSLLLGLGCVDDCSVKLWPKWLSSLARKYSLLNSGCCLTRPIENMWKNVFVNWYYHHTGKTARWIFKGRMIIHRPFPWLTASNLQSSLNLAHFFPKSRI